MSKQREALEKGLEWIRDALVVLSNASLAIQGGIGAEAEGVGQCSVKVVDAIREALAEPEPEPVAVVASQTGDPVTMSWHHEPALPIGTKLYTAPPARKPLTVEQVEDEWERITGHSIFGGDRKEGRAMYLSPDEVMEFARAIERAHGIGD